MCILILGGDRIAVRNMASLLAENGAMLFISACNENALKEDLNYISREVPGCSINGASANVSLAASISLFYLKAEIAFPKHDVLIYFSDGGLSAENFMLASNRLLRLMADRPSSKLINIVGVDASEKATPEMVNDLSKTLHECLGPLGIEVTEVAINYGIEDDNPSPNGQHDNALAETVLRALCNATALHNDKLSHHQ